MMSSNPKVNYTIIVETDHNAKIFRVRMTLQTGKIMLPNGRFMDLNLSFTIDSKNILGPAKDIMNLMENGYHEVTIDA